MKEFMKSVPKFSHQVPIPKLKRSFDILFSLTIILITLPLSILILTLIVIGHILTGNFLRPCFMEKRGSPRGNLLISENSTFSSQKSLLN